MFFKFGLLVGAALTIGLITIALVVNSGDQPDGSDPNQPVAADSVVGQIAEDGVQPVNSVKDDQPEATTEDPGLLIIWSDQQQGRLTVSLGVDDPEVTSCRFHLRVGDNPDALKALAKVVDTPSQRGCIGHFEGADELTNPVQLVIEGVDSELLVSCRFDLRGESENANGRDLFWDSSSPNCIGNFNP